jgi:hypothetical protein
MENFYLALALVNGEVFITFATIEKVVSLVKFVPLSFHGQRFQARF